MPFECEYNDVHWNIIASVNEELKRHGLRFEPSGVDFKSTPLFCKWTLKRTEPEKAIDESKGPRPKFKYGDLVRHRASGEKAIVVGVRKDRESYVYGLSIGFEDSDTDVLECRLELVEKEE